MRRVKLMVAKEFKYKYFQTQPTFAVCNTEIGWAMLRATFCLKKIEKVHIVLQNKGWIKFTNAKDWKKVKNQVVEQPSLKENGSFPCCLVIKIEE